MPEAVACPRHPKTATRLRCSRCDAVICPECMTPAPTGFLCRDCLKSDRASTPKVRTARTNRPPPVTMTLLVLIGLVAVATAFEGGMDLSGGLFGSATRLHIKYGMFAPSVAGGQWYRLLTSEFLHYGPLHLGMNAYGLFLLGPVLEQRLGSWRFLLLFVVSSLGASAGSAILEPFGLAAGASGALFGFLAAAVVLERRRGVNRLMGSQVGVWLVMGMVMTFAVPGLSVGGHLGGAVAGALASIPLFALERPDDRWIGVLAAFGVGVLATATAVIASMRIFG